MKKFLKQFEGLRLTERGDTVLVLVFGSAFWGSLLAVDAVGRVS